jgi:predicted kinase
VTTLHITRGLPASGKTTFAREWVDADRAQRARVNRDDLRGMIDEGVFIAGRTEQRVIVARDAMIGSLLRHGYDVICDDTNLRQGVARNLAQIAARAGADFQVEDFTSVPLELCIKRDAARARPVGEAVIRDMHARYLAGRTLPLPIPAETEPVAPTVQAYKAKPGTPPAVLVDVDGTAALMGDRNPYDETCVWDDKPNRPVIAVVKAMHAAGHRVIFMSGRTEGCRADTARWLGVHVNVIHDGLYMRAAGDGRADSIVKAELFDRHVRGWFDVRAVFDDRDQVVRMWRAMGLTVLQVAEGNF